jgi:hypothetical protein
MENIPLWVVAAAFFAGLDLGIFVMAWSMRRGESLPQ